MKTEKTIAVTLKLPAELAKKIDAIATAEIRSRTGQIIKLLSEHPQLTNKKQ